MMAEMKLSKRFFGVKFGYGELLQDGVFAIPTTTSKGDAFMKMEIVEGLPSGSQNFLLFWDEELTISWYDTPKPLNLKESIFSQTFRNIIKTL